MACREDDAPTTVAEVVIVMIAIHVGATAAPTIAFFAAFVTA